jgi:uncharacterized membrane protein YhaH (DUF805 family)
MSFTDAIKSFFANYANFSGRARRSEYWFSILFIVLASFATSMLDAFGGGGLITGLFSLAIIIPSLSLLVRRMHDTGKSGVWILMGLIPAVGGIILLVFACQDSTSANQWGIPQKTIY